MEQKDYENQLRIKNEKALELMLTYFDYTKDRIRGSARGTTDYRKIISEFSMSEENTTHYKYTFGSVTNIMLRSPVIDIRRYQFIEMLNAFHKHLDKTLREAEVRMEKYQEELRVNNEKREWIIDEAKHIMSN